MDARRCDDSPMSDLRAWLPRWKPSAGGVVAPDERLPAAQTLALGLQHVVAMFGATVLAPLLMGFDPNVAILFSGVGTLIFFVAVGMLIDPVLIARHWLAVVVFTATKMLTSEWIHVGAGTSALVIGVVLLATIAASAFRGARVARQDRPRAAPGS